jgi:hypothetical protein
MIFFLKPGNESEADMRSRTVRGTVFTILVDDKRIVVKHVLGKGKRCRVIAPAGVLIEEERRQTDVIGPGISNQPDSGETD